jgi:hypothetical protein
MKKILILAANPRKDLNLDREIRDLKRIIESSQDTEDFEVVNELAVRVSDLQDLLFKYRPQIVHFCGHGGGELGLMFESDSDQEQQVETAALSDLFRLFANNVECVLLNACYSETQADSIVDHINYVVGMNQAIRDDAAIAFAKGFYRALGYSCAIEEAFEFGCNAIQLEISGSSVARSEGSAVERKLNVVNKVESMAIPEHLKPKLKKKLTLSTVAEVPVISPQQRVVLQSVIDASLKSGSAVKSEHDRDHKSRQMRWWKIGRIALGLLALGELEVDCFCLVWLAVLSKQDKKNLKVAIVKRRKRITNGRLSSIRTIRQRISSSVSYMNRCSSLNSLVFITRSRPVKMNSPPLTAWPDSIF